LHVVDTPAGRVGGPICWENRMPLARYAVYGGDAVIGDEVRSAIGSQDGSHRTGHRGVSGIGWVGVPTVQKEVQSHSPWMFTGSGDPDVFVTAKAPATSATRPPTAVTAVVS
jgi:hypothetical protein